MLFTINKQKRVKGALNINKADFDYSYNEDNVEWYINGRIFYVINEKEDYTKESGNIKQKLCSLFNSSNFSPKLIKEKVEGHFVCVMRKNNEIIIFGDKFNRLSLFYTQDIEGIYFDTKLSDELIKRAGDKVDNVSLQSYFLIGYCHSSATIFKNIERLGYEDILFYDGELSKNNVFVPIYIENYPDEKLQVFEELFFNSIKCRMSDGINCVSNSSGWDSTLILDTLCKLTDRKNIKTAIFEVTLKDGRVNNKYEVDKAKRISKHYNVDNLLYKVNLSENELIDKWIKYAKRCFTNHIYCWPINHFGIAEYVKDKMPSISAVFNGETADSFQNYGFSQYASIHSGNNDFDEYADKMKTYLYGPSFFKEIVNGTYKNNTIYNIFKAINKNSQFDDKDNDCSKLMFSFIYSVNRLPFSAYEKLKIFTIDQIENFNKEIISRYFNRYLKVINPDNIYSIWSALYADFHFKGLAVPLSIRSIEESGMIPALPFFDIQLARFFEKMPEEWGRGLNLNSVKYPEKIMAFNSNTYPLHIVNDKMPHSYLSESDPTINPYYEYFCNSSVTHYFRDIISSKGALDWLLNIKGINHNYLEKVTGNFLNNNIRMTEFPTISKICMMSSILSEGLKIN